MKKPTTPRAAARRFLRRGWWPVPIKKATKRPPMKGWQVLRVDEDDIAQLWKNGAGVGVNLAASGLVDLDLDCDEARALAPSFLPPTNAIFGRKSARRSHYVYNVEDPSKTKKFHDTERSSKGKGITLVEFRCEGAQTVFPPSRHPSGERIAWTDGDKPSKIGSDDLIGLVARLAAATLLVRHWPDGARHDAALALAGALARADWEPDEIEHFVSAVAQAVGDEQHDDRQRAVRDTVKKVKSGERVTGLPTVAEIFGEGVVRKLKEWLGLGNTNGGGDLPSDISGTPDLAERVRAKAGHVAVGAGERLFIYDSRRGVYVDGEVELKRSAADQLGPKFSTHRLSETLAFLRLSVPALWDRPPDGVVNVRNGLLNVETRKLTGHSPDHLTTIQIGATFDPAASCPAIDRFLADVLPEDAIPALLEFVGLLLVPDTRHKRAALLLGSKDSGKSTMIRMIEALIGTENVSHISLHALTENRFAPVELVGRLVNIFADLDHRALRNPGVFKVLTGDDMISVERKYAHPFDYKPFARHIFSANAPPPTSDTSGAYFGRWLVFPFSGTVPPARRDLRLTEKLIADGELSGLLNAALEGLARLRDRGDFTVGASSKRAAKDYQRSADPVAAFLRERVRRAEGFVLRSVLHKAYAQRCRANKMPVPTRIEFNEHVRELLAGKVEERQKKKQGTAWWGIRLTTASTVEVEW